MNNMLMLVVLFYFKGILLFLYKLDHDCLLLKIYQGWSFTPDDVPAIHYQQVHLQVSFIWLKEEHIPVMIVITTTTTMTTIIRQVLVYLMLGLKFCNAFHWFKQCFCLVVLRSNRNLVLEHLQNRATWSDCWEKTFKCKHHSSVQVSLQQMVTKYFQCTLLKNSGSHSSENNDWGSNAAIILNLQSCCALMTKYLQ